MATLGIVEATRDRSRSGRTRAALFDPHYTMGGRFYERVFRAPQSRSCCAWKPTRRYIHDKYMTELVANQCQESTRDALTAIVARLKAERGVDRLWP